MNGDGMVNLFEVVKIGKIEIPVVMKSIICASHAATPLYLINLNNYNYGNRTTQRRLGKSVCHITAFATNLPWDMIEEYMYDEEFNF